MTTLLLALLLQSVPVMTGAGDPPASCGSVGQIWLNTVSGDRWTCNGSTYASVPYPNGGGGAPTDAEYWVGAANGSLSAEKNLGALGTGLVVNTAGAPSAYAGTSCTNQFPRSLNASGSATCASVSLTADVSGDLPLANVEQISTARILGRTTAGTGDIEQLTAANVQSLLGLANARVSADRTTTSTSLGNVTDLAVSVAASETWTCEVFITGGCNNTGGSQFAIDVPASAGSLRATWQGNTNAVTALTGGTVTTDDGVSPTFFTVNLAGQQARAAVTLVNGANAGSIQVRFKSVTNGQTTTVLTNSYMTCRRH